MRIKISIFEHLVKEIQLHLAIPYLLVTEFACNKEVYRFHKRYVLVSYIGSNRSKLLTDRNYWSIEMYYKRIQLYKKMPKKELKLTRVV